MAGLSKVGQVLIGLQESFLNRVLRVLPVMRNALSDAEKLAVLSLHQLSEGGGIPILAGMDQIHVAACFPRCFELCQACCHIIHPALNEKTKKSDDNLLSALSHCTTTLPVIFGWMVQ